MSPKSFGSIIQNFQLNLPLAAWSSTLRAICPTQETPSVALSEGFSASGRFDADGNAATLRRDLAGFIGGVDTRVGGNGRAGVAAGCTASRTGSGQFGKAFRDACRSLRAPSVSA